jgi:hypothetical protein
MKKIIHVTSIIFLALYLSACSAVQVTSEKPKNPKLSNYKIISVGWLDLGVQNWKSFGYKSPGEWNGYIREINIEWFQAEMKSELSSKRLIFARGPGAAPTGQLAILFSRTYLERHCVPGFGGYDYIFTTVTIKDLRNGRIIYVGKICSSSKGFGPSQWRLEGRFGFAARNIASFIGSKF